MLLEGTKVIAQKLFNCPACNESFTIPLKKITKERGLWASFITLECPWCRAKYAYDPSVNDGFTTLIVSECNPNMRTSGE